MSPHSPLLVRIELLNCQLNLAGSDSADMHSDSNAGSAGGTTSSFCRRKGSKASIGVCHRIDLTQRHSRATQTTATMVQTVAKRSLCRDHLDVATILFTTMRRSETLISTVTTSPTFFDSLTSPKLLPRQRSAVARRGRCYPKTEFEYPRLTCGLLLAGGQKSRSNILATTYPFWTTLPVVRQNRVERQFEVSNISEDADQR